MNLKKELENTVKDRHEILMNPGLYFNQGYKLPYLEGRIFAYKLALKTIEQARQRLVRQVEMVDSKIYLSIFSGVTKINPYRLIQLINKVLGEKG